MFSEMMSKVLIIMMLLIYSFNGAYAKEPLVNNLPSNEDTTRSTTAIFSTWEGFLEVDRCATAWLIKRFINKDAVFRFYKAGTTEMSGTIFDAPVAESIRTPNMTVYETFLVRSSLSDKNLQKIGAIVRDIELNTWGQKMTPQASGIESLIRGLNLLYEDDQICLDKSFLIFDALYADMHGKGL